MKEKLLMAALSFPFLFMGCKETSEPVAKVTPKKKTSLVIGNPLDCGIQDMLIFPVGSDYSPDVIEGQKKVTGANTDITVYANGVAGMCFASNSATDFYDRNAETEYVNNNENEFDIRNILFYNRIDGSTYQLISDTMHILSFAIHKEFANPLILYRVVKKDINKDSIYNTADAVMLYVSDIFGKHLTKITPDEEQFVDYYYYPQTQTILAKTIVNADHDSAFSLSDETNFREMQIKAPSLGREIFAKSLKDSLRLQGNTF